MSELLYYAAPGSGHWKCPSAGYVQCPIMSELKEMDGDELLQDGWQGGGIKQTGGPAENKCRRQLKYRTYPRSYFHLVSKLIKPLFPLQRHRVKWIFFL